MMTSEKFDNSILIAAHPDDEILWFSSLLDAVDEVLISFLECKSQPVWTSGRKKSLSEYPMKNILCFGMSESEVFDNNNWHEPVVTKFGIKLSDNELPARKYTQNYWELKRKLESKLQHYSNVITHNPWGEYGNEDHVQLYRVVRQLQEKLHFKLWFSNYCSNKSFNLMLQYVSCSHFKYITLETNKTLTNSIKTLYQKNGCWTWYDDWQWPDTESFIEDRSFESRTQTCGHFLPLNFVSVELSDQSKKTRTPIRYNLNFVISKLFGKNKDR